MYFSRAKIQAAYTNAALGLPQKPDFYCPSNASKCTWDDFTTLAICGDDTIDYLNVTRDIEVSCWDYQECKPQACRYTFPSGASRSDPNVYSTDVTIMSDSMHAGGQINISQLWTVVEDSGYHATKLAIVTYDRIESEQSGCERNHTQKVSFNIPTWRWCTKTFHNVTATPLGTKVGSITEENLIFLDKDTLRAESTGLIYRSGPEFLFEYFLRFGSNYYQLVADAGQYYTENTLGKLVAESFTSIITGNTTIRNPYLKFLEGKVYSEEVYINVRWYWLILPALEIALTLVFLVISMILNRHQPIFKNSILPYLAHGLEGWEHEELNIESETIDGLEKVLYKETAVLERGRDGQLKLCKYHEAQGQSDTHSLSYIKGLTAAREHPVVEEIRGLKKANSSGISTTTTE